MPANTANRNYTYATPDDANDLALISQRLAEQIDSDVQNLATVPGWVAPTFASGWATYSGNSVRYRKDRDVVRLEGLFARGTGSPSANEVIATGLPVPDGNGSELIIGTASGNAGASCIVGVQPNGDLRWKGGTYASWVSIYGLSYPCRTA